MSGLTAGDVAIVLGQTAIGGIFIYAILVSIFNFIIKWKYGYDKKTD